MRIFRTYFFFFIVQKFVIQGVPLKFLSVSSCFPSLFVTRPATMGVQHFDSFTFCRANHLVTLRQLTITSKYSKRRIPSSEVCDKPKPIHHRLHDKWTLKNLHTNAENMAPTQNLGGILRILFSTEYFKHFCKEIPILLIQNCKTTLQYYHISSCSYNYNEKKIIDILSNISQVIW